MPIRIAINGYGRIGRNVLRALYESGRREELQIVAINDLGDANELAYLTRYDSVHGPFAGNVETEGDDIIVNGDRIRITAQRDPAELPWAELQVDVVLECTGIFASREKASAHLKAGALKVLVSQPAGADVKTIVYGVNHDIISADDDLISNASCTTNCLAPMVKALHDTVGIETGIMSTVHAYTNDQALIDVYHEDLRRARSATQSMIPTKTGATSALELVLPEMAGKLDGFSIRVPTINVSLVDLTFTASRPTDVAELNGIMRQAAESGFNGVFAYTNEPLVSIDFNHNAASGTYDESLTKVGSNGTLVKVCAWYDNEWGFSNRMLDTALVFAAA
ncbi:MAG: type I glyceraldehyde-3-phosphate dehydrogenase [Salinisphaeraceae bacterium]|nr:type I glyceraldehyde-3-phosphate dehydrogenase [Salinisphaeraceae bacterium]